MLFSSLVFLFYFLPVALMIYYLSPKKSRNILLLIFSLVFYAWGGVSYTIILIISLFSNFIFAKRINKTHKKLWLIIGLIFNVSIIIVFKYLDFFIENMNFLAKHFSATYKGLESLNIILPLGISFFTFQQMSLLWDIYRNPEKRKIRFLETSLYISFFPQLIAGPIVRYKDIIHQIRKRKESLSLIHSGIRRFILGLFKKVVFANSCAIIADSIIDANIDSLSTPAAWLGIIAYSFQIYFDFSGYSDMAIGLGRIFGFRILENFNFPYISRSIQEFWRRWHISLSTWFRDYVYIPMGGNRKSLKRTYFNLLVVFLLTGFWHGATWSFVFWGAFHGFFLIIERIGFKKILEKAPNVFAWLYTIIVVVIGWVFFRIEYIPDAFKYVVKLFSFQLDSNYHFFRVLNTELIIILSLAAISSSLLMKYFKKLILDLHKSRFAFISISIENLLLLIMFVYSVMYVNSGSYNPFIYFRF